MSSIDTNAEKAKATEKAAKQQAKQNKANNAATLKSDKETQKATAGDMSASEKATKAAKDAELAREMAEKREIITAQEKAISAGKGRKQLRMNQVNLVGEVIYLLAEKPRTTPQLMETLKINAKSAHLLLQKMRKANLVRRVSARNEKNAKIYIWHIGKHKVFK